MKRVGLLDIIGVLFLALKLTREIHWSWILVLSPFIIEIILLAFRATRRYV